MTRFTFRQPVAEDSEAIGVTAAEGTATYAAFAPEGWTAPHAPPSKGQIEDPATWWQLAEVDGVVGGYVAFLPASKHPYADADPELAHLGTLFLRPAHHGSGLAAELLRRATVEAQARGYLSGRLFCAGGYVRARRFYEREGWWLAGEPFAEPNYGGLELVEYRLSCDWATSPRPPSS